MVLSDAAKSRIRISAEPYLSGFDISHHYKRGEINILKQAHFFTLRSVFVVFLTMKTLRKHYETLHMKTATLTKPTQCRFDSETKLRIETVARKFGIKPSSLIRHAVTHQLTEFEKAGRITIEKRHA